MLSLTHSLPKGPTQGGAERPCPPVSVLPWSAQRRFSEEPRTPPLRMNPALLLGAVTGAMTSTLAMDVVTEVAHSGVPALGYAGTYTFANVLLTFASPSSTIRAHFSRNPLFGCHHMGQGRHYKTLSGGGLPGWR